MNRMLTTTIFTALIATGCAPDPVICTDNPTRKPLEGTNGSSGPNGLLPDTFQEKAYELGRLMRAPLFTDPVTRTLTPDVTKFLESANGSDVFKYAIRCALPAGEVVNHGCSVYKGQGILTTTTQWTAEPLEDGAKEDLFTCIVTHLNPEGSVPIFLSGPSVAQDVGSKGYPVWEALWTSTLTEVGVTYSVWPLFPWPEMCAADPLEALKTRVCGHDAPQCYLDPRKDTFKECIKLDEKDDGRYACLGKPAIMTRLTNTDAFPLLYPACFPIPQ